MKHAFFISLTFISSIFAQQPPLPITTGSKQLDNETLINEKAEGIFKTLQELKETQKIQVELAFGMAGALINGKSMEAEEDTILGSFSCIIDMENDAQISTHLKQIREYVDKIGALEKKLSKLDAILTQNPSHLLTQQEEHELLLRNALSMSNLLTSVLHLSLRHAIRQHQKTARIRGFLPKELSDKQ